MPLIFQKQRRHGPHRNGDFRLASCANLSHINDDVKIATANGLNSRGDGLVTSEAASRIEFCITVKSSFLNPWSCWLRQYFHSIIYFARNPSLFLPQLKLYYKKWHLKHIIPLIFILNYMLVGAAIFLWLEKSPENLRMIQRNAKIQRERVLFVKRIDEIYADHAAMIKLTVRHRYIEEALNHLHFQLGINSANESYKGEWSLLTAMYYAGTIFTTIGYGDVVCATVAGQIITVVYAIIGIPIMLITLNHLGKFLYKWINEITPAFSYLFKDIKNIIFPKKYNKPKNEENHKKNINYDIKSSSVLIDNNNIIKQKQSSASAPPFVTTHMISENHVDFVLQTDNEEISNEELTLCLDVDNDDNTIESKVTPLTSPSQIISTHLRKETEKMKLLEEINGTAIDVEFGNTNTNLLIDNNAPELLPNEARMSVSVALTCTLTWIFFCAALFKLWETNWTYAESCYFMFISLSTIGLGDVNVKRKDLMVICFIFVIVGLSFVSMCINVIQEALEDIYSKLLMKVLLDYQTKIAEGGDAHSASMNMMKIWSSSKTAKYLMPILSTDTRRAVMQKFHQEVKETGMEIPPILENIDDKTGMPKILAVAATMEYIRHQSAIVDELVKTATAMKQPPKNTLQFFASPSISLSSEIISAAHPIYDNKATQATFIKFDNLDVQTDKKELLQHSKKTDVRAIQTQSYNTVDRNEQTDILEMPYFEKFIQTRRSLSQLGETSKATETESSFYTCAKETQTNNANKKEIRDVEVITNITSFMEVDVQTNKMFNDDAEIQTHLFDLMETLTQTNIIEMENESLQTVNPEMIEGETQTDEKENPAHSKNISKIRHARRRLQHELQEQNVISTRRVSHGDRQSLGHWRDPIISENIEKDRDNERLSEDDAEDDMSSSYESLNWNPIDGMHAEKQRPVSDLKKLFDQGNRTSTTASSQALNQTFSTISVAQKKKFSQQETKK